MTIGGIGCDVGFRRSNRAARKALSVLSQTIESRSPVIYGKDVLSFPVKNSTFDFAL